MRARKPSAGQPLQEGCEMTALLVTILSGGITLEAFHGKIHISAARFLDSGLQLVGWQPHQGGLRQALISHTSSSLTHLSGWTRPLQLSNLRMKQERMWSNLLTGSQIMGSGLTGALHISRGRVGRILRSYHQGLSTLLQD